MTPRDPLGPTAELDPTPEELDATDRLLDGLARGETDDAFAPVLSLLRTARSEPTADELVDPIGFSELVARAAAPTAAVPTVVPSIDVPTAAIPAVDERSGAASTRGPSRLAHVRRALAAKVAIVVGITAVGVAGAGAATGIIRATTVEPTPTTAAPPASTTAPEGGAADGATPGVDGNTERSFWSTVDERLGLAAEPVVPAGPGEAGGAGAPATDDPTGTAGGGNPDPGSTGAENGNSPNAGGNPNPGGTGNGNGGSPNTGGNPTPGSTGAENGNSPNAGGNPNPGGTGAENGNSLNAGGTTG